MEPTSQYRQSTVSFIDALKNLQGVTYGEKRKNLFILLRTFNDVDQAAKEEIAAAIVPKHHTEGVFYVETLIFFKMSNALFEILGEVINGTTRKILRQKWLFNRPLESMSVPMIVDDFLPKFSIVNRSRILCGIGKYYQNERKVDELFDYLKNKYGIGLAKLVLDGCSVSKIEFVLHNYNIQMKQYQLISIFKKSQDLFMSTIKASPSYYCKGQIKKLYRYMVKVDLMFCYETCNANQFKFGKRGTRMLLDTYKSQILQAPEKYLNFYICKRILKKKLTVTELGLALEHFFPKGIEDFRYYTFQFILDLIPFEYKYKIFFKTYEKMYSTSLWDNVNHMDEDMVEMVNDVEEREKWIEYKLKGGVSDTRYIHCYELSKAMQMIKSKMNVTSTYRVREVLMEKLVAACKLNYCSNPEEAKAALLEALKYVCKRHRNDDTISEFIYSLSVNIDLSEVSEEHWKYIHEIIEVLKAKHNLWNEAYFLSEYVAFLWKHKLPLKDHIILRALDDISAHRSNMQRKNKSLQKTFLLALLEKLPLKTMKNDDEMYQIDKELFLWLFEWNLQNYNDMIAPENYTRLLDSLKISLDRNPTDNSLEKMFAVYLCKKNPTDFEKYLLDLYFKKCLNKFKTTSRLIITWFLKNDPSNLSEYINQLGMFLCDKECHEKSNIVHREVKDTLTKSNHTIMSYIKKLHDYGFPQQVVYFILENYESKDINCDAALMCAAYLMTPESFIQNFQNVLPSSDRMDVDGDMKHGGTHSGNTIIKSLMYCQSTSVLPFIIPSCFNGYTNSALNVFHYYVYHCPTNNLQKWINEAIKHPTSGNILTFSIVIKFDTTENVIRAYKSLNSGADPPMRKKLLRKAFIYLKINPSDELFNITLGEIKYLQVTDRRILKTVKKMKSMSIDYKVKLLDIVFDYIDCDNKQSLLPLIGEILMNEFGSELNKISVKYKIKFLQFIVNHCKPHVDPCSLKEVLNCFLKEIRDDFFNELPSEICNAFIQMHFLKEEAFINKDCVENFTIHYIFYSVNDFDIRCNAFFHNISIIQRRGSDTIKAAIKCKQALLGLMSTICIAVKSKDPILVQMLHDNLLQICPPHDCIETIYFLRILILKNETHDMKVTCNKLLNLLVEMMSSFGPILPLFANCVKAVFLENGNSNEMLLSICQSLVKNYDTPLSYLLIISLLPWEKPKGKIELQAFNKLLATLSCYSDLVVKVQFSIFMKVLT